MVIKVYISGISGRKEVKKHQQRVMMIMDSKNIDYVPVDITEPGKEQEKEYMMQNSKTRDNNKTPYTPQLFNEELYCGDYDDFDLANEVDELEVFLKLKPKSSTTTTNNEEPAKEPLQNGQVNGVSSREASAEKEAVTEEKPASEQDAGGEPVATTEETPAAVDEQ